MINDEYEVLFAKFRNTSEIPKDNDLFYRCTLCATVIPSIPADNIGCTCGNVFIDKDYWRLIVANLKKFEIVKQGE